MRRTTIITCEVGENGAALPGSTSVIEIYASRCPQTCMGVRLRFQTLEGTTPWGPCTDCGAR